MPKLSIRDPNGQTREVDLSDCTLRIGRGDQNDIVLPDSTKSVSRLHAELHWDNGRYVLVDANSQNGIWVGERRLQTVTLEPDVPVLVGSCTITLADSVSTDTATALPTMVRSAGTISPSLLAPPRASPAPSSRSTSRQKASGRRRSLITPMVALLTGLGIVLVAAIAVVVVVRGRHRASEQVAVATPLELPAPVPPPPSTPTPEEQLQDHLAKARSQLVAKEFDDASAEADAVLAIDPANVEAQQIKANATAERQRAATPPPPSPPPAVPKTTTPPAQNPPFTPPLVPRRAGESQEDWVARGKRTQDRYDAARAAFTAGQFQNAFNALTTLQRDEPSYRDVPTLLIQARNGMLTAVQPLLDGAAKAENAGELSAALAHNQRAQPMGASVSGDIDRVHGKMKVAGTRAFADAKQAYALGRIKDALPLYECDNEDLTDDDPNRRAAKERLDALRGQQ